MPDGLNSLARLVLISGTNGKTTTTALLAAALRAAGHEVWTNPTGSNLERGIAAALVRRAAWHGEQRRERAAIGVFEVDEWALARAPAAREADNGDAAESVSRST